MFKAIFEPKSVAIIGASREPSKIGHAILANFIDGGFEGDIYPINPNVDEILGLKVYKSVKELKGKVDLVVVAVPAQIVPQVMKEAGEAGVKGAIIITGGFSEIGKKDLENEVERIIKKYEIATVGVNCLGIFDPVSRVDTLFLPYYKLERPRSGGIGFITQSGAIGSAVLDWAAKEGFGVSKFISYGNATDLDEVDFLEYLGKDKKTKVIVMYLEGVKKGKKFMEVAKKVTKKKPIVVIKAGKTEKGARAVQSHTGALAGSAEVYSAVFKQCNIVEVETIEELFDLARAFDNLPLPKGKRTQIITNGGGMGVLCADALIENNLELAEMSDEIKNKLKEKFPPHVVVSNPMDLIGDADIGRYELALDAAVEDKNVDAIIVVVLYQTVGIQSGVVDIILKATNKSDKPILVVSSGGAYTETHMRMLEVSGVPAYSSVSRAVKTLEKMWEYSVKNVGKE